MLVDRASVIFRALPLVGLPLLLLGCGGSSSETPYPKQPHADHELPKYSREKQEKTASSLLPAESQTAPADGKKADK